MHFRSDLFDMVVIDPDVKARDAVGGGDFLVSNVSTYCSLCNPL
jgi:hypothetical protein